MISLKTYPKAIMAIVMVIIMSCAQKSSLKINNSDEKLSFIDSVALFHNQALSLCLERSTKAEEGIDLTSSINLVINCVDEVLINNNVNYSLQADKEKIYSLTSDLLSELELCIDTPYTAYYNIIDKYFVGEEKDNLKTLLSDNFELMTKSTSYLSVDVMQKIGMASKTFWQTRGSNNDEAASYAADALGGAVGCVFGGPVGWFMLGVSAAWSYTASHYKEILKNVAESGTD